MNKSETMSSEQFPVESPATYNILPRPSKFKFRPERKPIPTSTMVKEAIKSQMTTPHRGVSLVAIKKFIWQNYLTGDIDIASRMRFIKSYIVRALNNGSLVRTRGSSGVAGSFRLPLRERRTRRTIKKTKKKKVSMRKLKAIKKQIRKKIKKSVSSVQMRRQQIARKRKSKQSRK